MKSFLFSLVFTLSLVAGLAQAPSGEKTVLSYNSIRDLLLMDPTSPNTTVVAEGLVSTGDNGGGVMRYYSDSTEATNAVFVFKPVNYGGRWKLILGGPGTNSGGGGGGSQTPWLQDINGNTFSLTNATQLQAITLLSSAPTNGTASAFQIGLYSGGGSNVARLQMGTNVFDLDTVGSGGPGGTVGTLINTTATTAGNLVKFTSTDKTNTAPASSADIQAALGQVYQETNTTLTRLAGIGAGTQGDVIYRDANGWTNAILPAFLWTNAPTATSVDTNAVEGSYLVYPASFFQVSSNLLDLVGQVGSVIIGGAATGDAQTIASASTDIVLIGDRSGSSHVIGSSYDIFGIGEANFAFGTNTLSSSVSGIGSYNFNGSKANNVASVAFLGESNFGGGGYTSIENLFAVGAYNFSQTSATTAQFLYGIGYSTFRSSALDNAYDLVALGYNVGLQIGVTNSADMLFANNSAGYSSNFKNSDSIQSVGAYNLSAATVDAFTQINSFGNYTLQDASISGGGASANILALGDAALKSVRLTNSSSIVALGFQSFKEAIVNDSSYITAIGPNALDSATITNSQNILAIGRVAGSSYTFDGITEAVMIGNGAIATNSYDFNLGNQDNTYHFPGSGGAYFAGKVNAEGGIDPPYLLLDPQTRAGLADRVSKEVPKEKGAGAALYFNQATKKLEYFVASEGNYYDLAGNVLESRTAPDLKTTKEQQRARNIDNARNRPNNARAFPAPTPARRTFTNAPPARITGKTNALEMLRRPTRKTP